jgi:hypothetical protein
MGPNIYVQYNSNWFAPDPWWTFVPRRHFCSDNWNDYIYDKPVYVTNITYINNVYVENNYTTVNHNSWYQGPRVSEVERYYGHRVSTMEVVDNERHENTGVRNNQLNIYRPTVDNRRNDSRPTEYRNIEQAHRNSTSLSTNPRTNNPGENRSRENKVEPRNTSQLPSTVKKQNRVEPRKTDQSLPNRSADVTKDSREAKVPPRTTTKPETRTGSSNRETKIEPRATSQVPVDRNSKGTSVKPRGNDTELSRNSGVTESSRSKTNPASIDNKSSQQTRNNPENRGNVNSSASRGSGSKQAANVEPSQKPKTTDVASTSNSRTQNTYRKQTSREVVKQGENQKSVVSTEKRKSGNKTSR